MKIARDQQDFADAMGFKIPAYIFRLISGGIEVPWKRKSLKYRCGIAFPFRIFNCGVGFVAEKALRTIHEDAGRIAGLCQLGRFDDAGSGIVATKNQDCLGFLRTVVFYECPSQGGQKGRPEQPGGYAKNEKRDERGKTPARCLRAPGGQC